MLGWLRSRLATRQAPTPISRAEQQENVRAALANARKECVACEGRIRILEQHRTDLEISEAKFARRGPPELVELIRIEREAVEPTLESVRLTLRQLQLRVQMAQHEASLAWGPEWEEPVHTPLPSAPDGR